MRTRWTKWLLAGALVGCQLEDPDEADDGDDELGALDEERAGGGGGTGTGWGCRTCGFSNSPLLGQFDLGEFVMGAPAPAGGFRLIGIEDPGGTMRTVVIDKNAFVGKNGNGNVTGAQLVGWSLVFEDDTKAQFDVEIAAYAAPASWASGTAVATYTLLYMDPNNGDNPTDLCPGLGDGTSVTLLGGETYDFATKSVEPNKTGWTTIACRGHALAKLRMLGYAPNDGQGSTWTQRQATLKMLTADYCGTGQSFTVVGQPLDWADSRGSFALATMDPSRLEAKWNDKGATCLDKPRHALRTDVDLACAVPLCNGDFTFGGKVWISTLQ